MATSPQQWAANQMSVFLLKNIAIDDNTEKVAVTAQRASSTATYKPPVDSKKHFVFAVTMGRYASNYRDDTVIIGSSLDYHRDIPVGVNTLDCFFIGTGANMPTVSLYQYDGGGTLIADYII